MIKLDDNLLQELGLSSLPPEEKKKLLAHIYETLEMRVGMELAKQMSDGQLNEFEQFINRNDEAGALQWLESNFPNYKDVVAAEFEKLKVEIKQNAPHIIASSQQQAQQMASGQYPPMQPQYAQPQPMQQYPQQPHPGYAPAQPQYAPAQPQYGPAPGQPYPPAQPMPQGPPGGVPQYPQQPPMPPQYPPQQTQPGQQQDPYSPNGQQAA
jgi:hypothetical protein